MPRLLSNAEYCKRILHEAQSTKIEFDSSNVSDLISSFVFNIEYFQLSIQWYVKSRSSFVSPNLDTGVFVLLINNRLKVS